MKGVASVTMRSMRSGQERCRTPGATGLADALCDMVEVIMDHPGMKAFLTSEPRRALTILTGPGSVVHDGIVERFTDLIDQRCPEAAGDLTSRDLAYALVRLAEAFCYTDLTTGRPSEVRRAHPLFLRILKG